MKYIYYICITESLCYTPKTKTTLWINYVLIFKKSVTEEFAIQ